MNNAKIVVVDDDQGVVTLIQNTLTGEGYSVFIGFDGQMAMQLVRQHKPNLLILDVHMPMTNGLQAVEFLRSAVETAGLPIILLTGARSDTIYPIVDQHQRVVFMKKPVDIEELLSCVRQQIEKYSV